MKVTKPTIHRGHSGTWYCGVPGHELRPHIHYTEGVTSQAAYRAWVDAASRAPWHYGVCALDMEYHREQVQQMEANVAFKGVDNAPMFESDDDEEGESNYLDDRLDAVKLLVAWPTALPIEEIERQEGLFADLYMQNWTSGCGGAPPGNQLRCEHLPPPPAPIEMRD